MAEDNAVREILHMIEGVTRGELDEFFESQPNDGTSTILVKDLKEKYPNWKEMEAVRNIIEGAEKLKYDDMHDEDGFGKVFLAKDLTAIGALDLVKKVKDGAYDF